MISGVKPIISGVKPWDALKGTSIYFKYTGSRQTLENNLVIIDSATGLTVYSYDYSTFEKVHHIPPNALQNGKQYKAKIRVKTSDGSYSPFSTEVSFKTLKTPVIDIINIDGQGYVYNSDVTFEATYEQENGESVRTYRFSLYNHEYELIESYPLRVPENPTYLTETIVSLEKNKPYYIECKVETYSGLIYKHIEKFTPLYIVPNISGIVKAENDKEEGFIKVSANVREITRTQIKPISDNDKELKNDEFTFNDNEWVVVDKDKPLVYKGLGMNSSTSFVIKIWCKNIPDNTRFLQLTSKGGGGATIEFWKYSDKIVAIKNIAGIDYRYRSDIQEIPDDTEYMVYAKVVDNYGIDLEVVQN